MNDLGSGLNGSFLQAHFRIGKYCDGRFDHHPFDLNAYSSTSDGRSAFLAGNRRCSESMVILIAGGISRTLRILPHQAPDRSLDVAA